MGERSIYFSRVVEQARKDQLEGRVRIKLPDGEPNEFSEGF